MLVAPLTFEIEKRQHLAKLAAARASRGADEAALPVLDAINRLADFYTTSSCAGRIQLLVLPALGDKAGSVVLGRWHEAPDLAALLDAFRRGEGGTGERWLHAQPPIFHVEARTLPAALRLRRLAEDAGFKHSTLREVRPGAGALVELASTERLETPVAGEEMLAFLHPRAVAAFERGRAKLARLTRAVADLAGSREDGVDGGGR